jgi:hypothetical protein
MFFTESRMLPEHSAYNTSPVSDRMDVLYENVHDDRNVDLLCPDRYFAFSRKERFSLCDTQERQRSSTSDTHVGHCELTAARAFAAALTD